MYYLRSRAAADAIKFTVDTSILKVMFLSFWTSHHCFMQTSYFVFSFITLPLNINSNPLLECRKTKRVQMKKIKRILKCLIWCVHWWTVMNVWLVEVKYCNKERLTILLMSGFAGQCIANFVKFSTKLWKLLTIMYVLVVWKIIKYVIYMCFPLFEFIIVSRSSGIIFQCTLIDLFTIYNWLNDTSGEQSLEFGLWLKQLPFYILKTRFTTLCDAR